MIAKLPRQARVLSNIRVGSNGSILQIEAAAPHQPGQVMGLSLPPAGPQRWYSISSAAGLPWHEILYTRVEDGQLTPGLWDLGVGDTVWTQPPKGSFLDPDLARGGQAGPGRIWWICNGTGVSPFLSIIRSLDGPAASLLAQRVLVFGCRTREDAFARDEIEAACRRHGLTCVLCLSAADPLELPPLAEAASLSPGLHVFPGRLTAWPGLEAIPGDDRAMLCGASAMVAEVREGLQRRGMPLASIFAEIYF